MDVDASRLFALLIGTAIVVMLGLPGLTNSYQRLTLIGMATGLLVFSGIGAAYEGVPTSYLASYFGFLVALVLSFTRGTRLFSSFSQTLGSRLQPVMRRIESQRGWAWVLPAYIALTAAPLVYPDLRLGTLLNPPPPDLAEYFARRFETRALETPLKIAAYARMSLLPFFYISIFRYRQRLVWVGSLFATILYLQYVDESYLGRGAVATSIGILGAAVWMTRPASRRFLVVSAIAALPVLLALSYTWTVIRLGNDAGSVTFWNALEFVVEGETSFPLLVGAPIIESAQTVDLVEYLKWVVTLPIPKILTGEIDGARINYEISEIVLNKSAGSPGFFVVLPGLVGESVYLFGRYFFWLHAVSLGLLAAFACSLMERTPQLLFLKTFVFMLFCYSMNRGGISSVLPQLTAGFLLFYIFLVFAVRLIPSQRPRSTGPPSARRHHARPPPSGPAAS